jgi:protein arginine N-methyltransferase 1
MYSINFYGRMIADDVRMNGYVSAMEQLLKPDGVVLDIGTGTGICALLACRLGARRVYAVEPADVISIARETARENGFADRIEFFQSVSTRVILPEPADLIVSDLRGSLPLFQQHLPAIIDARRRLLAPAGVLIPARDVMKAAIVEAPDLYREYVGPWSESGLGFTAGAAKRVATNCVRKARFKPEQLLVAPEMWAELDYSTLNSPDVSGSVAWTVARSGVGHGLCIWFDAFLGGTACFSNAPGNRELIYGTAFFPWSAPVALDAGDTVSVDIRADLVGDDYVWQWESRVLHASQRECLKAHFKQSTFFGLSPSPKRLIKRAANHTPTLNDQGELDRRILTLMDGRTSLEDIACQVVKHFPSQSLGLHEILTRAGELAEIYGR